MTRIMRLGERLGSGPDEADGDLGVVGPRELVKKRRRSDPAVKPELVKW